MLQTRYTIFYQTMNYKLYHSSEIVGSTTLDFDHSVGFHDIRPFNKKNNNLIPVHRYPLNTLGFKNKNNHKVDICLWNFLTSKIEKIDETNLWSWEQGARLQWYNDTNLIYNNMNNQKELSTIYNITNHKKSYLDECIYSLNNENLMLNVNFSRLWKLWKSYGYNNLKYEVNSLNLTKPKEDGIFLYDINHKKKLLLSIETAVKLCKLDSIDKEFFLCHPTFNPSGSKFLSILRYFSDSGALISYLICTDIKNRSHKIIAREKVSHFEWISDNKIIVWCRNLNEKIIKLRNNYFLEKKIFPILRKVISFSNMNLRNKILSDDYHIINVDNPSKPIRLNNKLLNVDGHPQISPDKKLLITDTYADEKGYLKLLLFNIQTNKVYKIGEFKIANYLKKNNLKYDLHPRWDNTGKLINFDSSHLGSRQTFVLNIEQLISKIN